MLSTRSPVANKGPDVVKISQPNLLHNLHGQSTVPPIRSSLILPLIINTNTGGQQVCVRLTMGLTLL